MAAFSTDTVATSSVAVSTPAIESFFLVAAGVGFVLAAAAVWVMRRYAYENNLS